MVAISLFVCAVIAAVGVGLAARSAMAGALGHRVEDMGRLIGG